MSWTAMAAARQAVGVGASLVDRLLDGLDALTGLPSHPLLLHGVVVGVPVLAVVTVVLAVSAVRGRLSGPRPAWWLAAANTGLLALTYLTVAAGRRLQAALGGEVALEHGALGSRMPLFSLALLGASVLVAVTARRPRAARVTLVVAVVVAVAATAWVVRVGHTGSEVVWSGVPLG